MILLTEEEKWKLINYEPDKHSIKDSMDLAAKAQLKKVVEWFLTHGYSGGAIHYSDGIKARFDPPWDEWQALLEEAKE